ncbi:MAG: hypothetical protein P8Y28_12105 [Gammaproteobacteria bacterium]|jgi:hypothetical protein
MAKKIDLDTIAKEYAEGRISRDDFLYLHKMLTTQTAGNKQPVQQAPPVLTGGRPVKAGARQQKSRPAPKQAASAQARRSIRPGTTPPVAQPGSHATHNPAATLQTMSQKSSIFGYVRKHHKEAVALLGTFGIFISMFYNKIETPDNSGGRVLVIQEQNRSQGENQSQSPRLRTQDIKLIAQLMMEDNSWNKDLIDDFVAQWNKLSDHEKQTIKDTDWYSLFSTLLSQQIKTTRVKAKTGDVTAIYNQQALLGLADTLVFGNDKQARETLAKMASSDSKRTEHKKQARKESNQGRTIQNKSKTQTAKISSKSKNTKTTDSNRHRISRKEIENVINRFTIAVEAGHTRDLADLFAGDDYSSSFASLDQIKKEYRKLFRTTKNRNIELSSLFWEHDYGEARGTAEYTANIEMTGDNVKKTVTANLDITLRRLMGKVFITDFKLTDRDVVTHAPGINSTAFRKTAAKEKPKHPTPAELQDLVTQYMTAYETGDAEELMHLFANATWTKSRTGLVEMKQNYDNLFTTTSGREIFVNNIKWTFKGKKALGTGELSLTHHTGDNEVKLQKGKIRIVATKVGDQVRFSQMFHIVE